ncbi:MAG: glycosyltransferase family 39 protein [Bdellovibrionaceae bacterium]|nr:glycosyltransferase family 39 protein [Pseudobdellovibrionaceae bacterium]
MLGVAGYLINIGSVGPMIQADEGSYLANAAAIAGYRNDMASSYHGGYSLIIAPVFWLASSPLDIWAGIKLVNSMLYAVTVFILGLLVNAFFPAATARQRLVGVTLAAIYPMWVVLAGYSFPQIAFVPLYLLVVYLFYRSMRSDAAYWWPMLGVAAAYAYWIHPMGAPVIAAVVFAALYWARVAKDYSAAGLCVLAIVASLISYEALFVPWLHEHMTIGGLTPRFHYPGLSESLVQLQSMDGWIKSCARLAGKSSIFRSALWASSLLAFLVFCNGSRRRIQMLNFLICIERVGCSFWAA